MRRLVLKLFAFSAIKGPAKELTCRLSLIFMSGEKYVNKIFLLFSGSESTEVLLYLMQLSPCPAWKSPKCPKMCFWQNALGVNGLTILVPPWFIIRDFKIHYGGLLLQLPRLWGTRLTTLFPPQTSNRLRFRCTAMGCNQHLQCTCLYKNGYVRLYSTFIWQRADQWQWVPSLVSILHLPELTFASQLLLEPPVIPTTKRNNTDKKRIRCSYNVINPKIQSFQF